MSFGDIWHTIDNVGQSIGNAGKDIAVAEFTAVPGLAYDLTSPIYTDNKFDPGRAAANFAGRAFRPLTDSQSITGALVSPIMQGADKIYSNAISEPISTVLTELGHVQNTGNVGSLFNARDWSKAYDVSQHRSIGQSALTAAAGWNIPGMEMLNPLAAVGGAFDKQDPLNPQAYHNIHDQHPFIASAASGATDAVVRFKLDPLILAGKAASVLHTYQVARPITAADRAYGIDKAMTEQTSKTLRLGSWDTHIGKEGLATRTDALVGKIEGSKFVPGAIDKFSTGQLYHAIPELNGLPYGRQFAQLLEDTKLGTNAAARINARKMILGVAQGDTNSVSALNDMMSKLAGIHTKVNDLADLQAFHATDGAFSRAMMQGLDEMQNISAQQTIMVDAAGLQDEVVKTFAEHGLEPPILAWGGDPTAVANAQSQVANLKDLGSYVSDSESQLKRLDNITNQLDFSPRVTAGGERAAAKAAGDSILRSGVAATGHPTLDRAVNHFLSRPIVSTYQSSPTAMPLRIIRSVPGEVAGKMVQVRDVIGAERPTGQVNFNDIGQVSREFDNMLRKAKVAEPIRLDYAAKVARTTMPFERQKLLAQVESEVSKSLAEHYGITDAEEFLRAAQRRASVQAESLSVARAGRAYSAVPARLDTLTPEQLSHSADSGFVYRIDHVGDDGIPTAMPVLDSAQDASIGYTMDVNALARTYKRYAGLYKAANQQYLQEAADNAVVAQRAAQGAHALDFGLETFFKGKDATMSVLDEVNRVWKFAQLARLGYLQRIILDDHFRIAAKFGSETLRVGLGEGGKNFWSNHFVDPAYNKYQRKVLLTAKALREDVRGSDEHFKYNQQAWAQIAKNEKKLQTVTSESRRAELQKQRDVLLDFHPTNLKGVDEELQDINKRLADKSYGRPTNKFGRGRRHVGTGKIVVDGVSGETHINDGFEGPYGETYRQLNSSAGSWSEMGASIESQAHGNLMRAGSFRTYTPEEDKHIHAWAETLNNQLRRSQLVKMAWEGKSQAQIEAFIRETPEGRAMARAMPWQGGNPEQWAQHVTDMAHQYAPTDELQNILLERETTAEELNRLFPTLDMRPSVHGGVVDANIGKGGVSEHMNSLMNRFYSWVGRNNDAMSRHPLFVVQYRHEARRLSSLTADVARKEGRTEFTSEEINGIEQKARERAMSHVNKTLFEMGATTELQHYLRIVSPFFGAWREGLDRWWGIIAKDPSAVRKFQMGFDIPRKLGLVVDENGNPVEPGAPIADNNYILIQMPPAWAKKPSDAWKTDFKVGESSFNLIFQGGGIFNPGFGPLVQIPANKLAVDNPEYAKKFEAILPLGTETSLMSPIIPSQLKSLWTYESAAHFGHYSTQYKQYNAMILRDMAVEWQQAHPGETPTESETNKLIEEAGNRTLAMAKLKAWSGFISPASLQIDSKFAPQLQAYRRLSDYAYQHNKPFFWATNKFVEQYGKAFYPLVQSSALNNGGLSSTDKTVQYIKDNRHLFNLADPKTYRMIVGGAGDGAYSQAARNYFYTHPMQPGSSTPFVSLDEPRDALTSSLVSEGWFTYDQQMSKLDHQANLMGLASYLDSPELQAQKKTLIANLAKSNTQWFQDYSTHNDAQYNQMLESMHTIANDPKLNADPGRSDIKVLQQYLALRSQYTAVLQQAAQYGGSASPQALSNRGLMLQFQQSVSQLKESNLWFSKYDYQGIIEHDPYLQAAGSAIGTGTTAPVAPPQAVA